MTQHLDKNINSIKYNLLNLPNQFTVVKNEGFLTSSENYNYTYRADGTKLKVHKSESLSQRTTDYLDGFQYERFIIGKILGEIPSILQFVPTAEGYYDFEKNKYIYNYTDHLGNVRVSYFHNGTSVEVLEESNYYPFGLKHQGYNELAGNTSYQYKYNGKELQETGMYDYGARMYMPDLGRWGVMDPLAEVNRAWSPYRYAYNNPLRFIDPDGRLENEVDESDFTASIDIGYGRTTTAEKSSGAIEYSGASTVLSSKGEKKKAAFDTSKDNSNTSLSNDNGSDALKDDCFFCKKIKTQVPLTTKIQYSKTKFDNWKEGKLESGIVNYLVGKLIGKVTSSNKYVEDGIGVLHSIYGSLKYEARYVYAELNVTSFDGTINVNMLNRKIEAIQGNFTTQPNVVPIRFEERVVVIETGQVIYNHTNKIQNYPTEYNRPLKVGEKIP